MRRPGSSLPSAEIRVFAWLRHRRLDRAAALATISRPSSAPDRGSDAGRNRNPCSGNTLSAAAPGGPPMSSDSMAHLQQTDPQIAELISKEQRRQESTLELIASENHVSAAVLEAAG